MAGLVLGLEAADGLALEVVVGLAVVDLEVAVDGLEVGGLEVKVVQLLLLLGEHDDEQ